MATQEYWTWIERGKPWELATPIRELRDLARAHGVSILGTIGNDDHLKASFPEDHTPFSYTEWPVAIGEYVVCAIDLADGPWMDRMLADAEAGRAPWIKYLNFRGGNYSIRNGWARRSSSDPHGHVSIRSDWWRLSIGAYNPFSSTGATSMTDLDYGNYSRPTEAVGDRPAAVLIADIWNLMQRGVSPYLTPQPANRPSGKSFFVELLEKAAAPVVVDPIALATALAGNSQFITNLAAAIANQPLTPAQIQQIEDAAFRGANQAEDA